MIEGISRLSLHLLKQEPIQGLNPKEEFSTLFKSALEELQKGKGFSDFNFPNRLGSVIHYLGELRNSHSDISHGRASLKEQLNDADFAEFVQDVTESLCIYMLRRLDKLAEKELEYDENEGFNTYLDNQYPMPHENVRYSKALFDFELETYALLLSDYQLESELGEE